MHCALAIHTQAPLPGERLRRAVLPAYGSLGAAVGSRRASRAGRRPIRILDQAQVRSKRLLSAAERGREASATALARHNVRWGGVVILVQGKRK